VKRPSFHHPMCGLQKSCSDVRKGQSWLASFSVHRRFVPNDLGNEMLVTLGLIFYDFRERALDQTMAVLGKGVYCVVIVS
jgi:hypothetical protein